MIRYIGSLIIGPTVSKKKYILHKGENMAVITVRHEFATGV